MGTEFFPERTIRYKTYAKRTLVDGLNLMFREHPDELIRRTKASIEYPKTEVDYPSVVIRFFERSVFNAGVGHFETTYLNGESDSIEISATVVSGGSVQLNWPPALNATAYKVYRGTTTNQQNESWWVTSGTSFTDTGAKGTPDSVPTQVTALIDPPQPTTVVGPVVGPGLAPGEYFYRVTAIFPSEAVKYQHYFYNADIEFAVYALSAYDRDLISDTLVQTIAMGTLEEYTNNFFERIYPEGDVIPDAQLHFVNINSDQIQGFGESQGQVPWGSEDDLMYMTSYRIGVFGELYSLPPEVSYSMVRRVLLYPAIEGIDPEGGGAPADANPWISNSTDGF